MRDLQQRLFGRKSERSKGASELQHRPGVDPGSGARTSTASGSLWSGQFAGCRRGEICKIQPEDIGEKVLRIEAGNTKTMRYREVPIVPTLRPWLAHLPLATTFEGVKSGIRRARVKAGLPGIGFHILRHSCATILLSPPINAPMHVVREILGHTSIKTTERYAHVLVHPQRDSLERLGDLHRDLHRPLSGDKKGLLSA